MPPRGRGGGAPGGCRGGVRLPPPPAPARRVWFNSGWLSAFTAWDTLPLWDAGGQPVARGYQPGSALHVNQCKWRLLYHVIACNAKASCCTLCCRCGRGWPTPSPFTAGSMVHACLPPCLPPPGLPMPCDLVPPPPHPRHTTHTIHHTQTPHRRMPARPPRPRPPAGPGSAACNAATGARPTAVAPWAAWPCWTLPALAWCT